MYIVMAIKREKIDLMLLMNEKSTTSTTTSHLADVKKPMSPRLRELRQEQFRSKKMYSLPSRLENDSPRGSLTSDIRLSTPEHRKSTKRLSIANARSQKQRIMDFASKKKMWLHKTINYDDRRDSSEIGLINHGVITSTKDDAEDIHLTSSNPDIICGSDSSISCPADTRDSLDSADMVSSVKSLDLNHTNHYSFDCRDSAEPLVETYNRRWNSLPEKLKQDSIDKSRKSSVERVQSPLASYQSPFVNRLNTQLPHRHQTVRNDSKNFSFDYDEPTEILEQSLLNFDDMLSTVEDQNANSLNSEESSKNDLLVENQCENNSNQNNKIKIYSDTRARSLPETIVETCSESSRSNKYTTTFIISSENHADDKRTKYAQSKHKSNDDIVDSADHNGETQSLSTSKRTTKYKKKKYHVKKMSIADNHPTCNHRQCLQAMTTSLQSGSIDNDIEQEFRGCRFKRMNSLPECSHPMAFWNSSFEDMKNERHLETVEIRHSIVDVEKTDFQNNVSKWNIDEMITAYIEKQNEDHVTLANDSLIFGAERLLLLPDKFSLDDKYIFLKKRHIRRNAVHIYDPKKFKDLLTVYISMKRVMGYSIL